MSIIKLTKQGNPILVNFANVTNVEAGHQGLTKLYYTNGNYAIVEESMERIYDILWADAKQHDINWDVTTVEDAMATEMSHHYHRPRPAQNRVPREQYRAQRNGYNSYNSFNDNSY
jgi:glutamate-1-semialdehyde aminotransferase